MEVKGYGNRSSKVVFLGEAPGATEEREGKPFIGPSGEVLNDCLVNLGYPDWRDRFYVTNVYKHRPPGNIIKRVGEVCDPKEQIALLQRELAEIEPNIIIALGKTALQAVTGKDKIMNYRGTVLENINGQFPKVIGAIHPANLVRSSNESGDGSASFKFFPRIWKYILQLDIKKGIDESGTCEFNWPRRLITIARSPQDIWRFIRAYPLAKHVYVDVETFGCTLCSCVSLAFDSHHAISIPLFTYLNGGNVKLTDMSPRDMSECWRLLDGLFRRLPISGQNLKFDQAKLEMLGFSFPKGIWSDVALKAHTVNPEYPLFGLAFLSSIYTRERFYKDEGKEFSYFHSPISQLLHYNAMDSAVTAEIDEKLDGELLELSDQYKTDLVRFYEEYVRPQHEFYFDMERVGFRVDEGVRAFLQAKYEQWEQDLEIELEVSLGWAVNVNSHLQVKEVLYEQLGLPPQFDRDRKLKSDEDAIARLLDGINDEPRKDILQNILTLRRVKKTLSTYVMNNVDADGKMRTQYRIIGTETGRSSTAILDPPTRPVPNGFAFQTLTKHGDIGQDVRSYLKPEKGFVFVNLDLSQAEARVVANLCKDYTLLSAFDRIDIHRRTACLCLLTGKLDLVSDYCPKCSILDKNGAERFIGKKVRHAGNYNMKWKTFLDNVVSDCRRFDINFPMSAFRAKQILERFHAASPSIREVFHEDVVQAIAATRALITPFGRIRRFFGSFDEQLWKEAFATIPQDTVKQRLTRSGMEFKRLKMPIRDMRIFFVGESHDSLLSQMPLNEAADICREMKPIMEQPIDFSRCSLPRPPLVIPCEFEWGENYNEFEPLKIEVAHA